MRCFSAAGFLALFVVAPAPSPMGVLIGLHRTAQEGMLDARHPAPPDAGHLRSVWVNGADPSALKSAELPDLLVPRRTGFWRMGLVGFCSEEQMLDADDKPMGTMADIADYLWAAPVGTRPVVRLDAEQPESARRAPCRARDIICTTDERTTVYWVWPEYASLEVSMRSDCGAHPDWEPGYTVRSLDHLDRNFTVGEVLGPRAQEMFRQAFNDTDKPKEQCGDEAIFDPASWYVERQEGTWQPIGWSTTRRICGYGIDYPVDADVSRISGRRGKGPDWERAKAKWPKLSDLHASPDGRWLLVVTETQLSLVDATAADRAILTVPKGGDEDVVMVEWATGPHVATWNDTVDRLRRTKELPPRVITTKSR